MPIVLGVWVANYLEVPSGFTFSESDYSTLLINALSAYDFEVWYSFSESYTYTRRQLQDTSVLNITSFLRFADLSIRGTFLADVEAGNGTLNALVDAQCAVEEPFDGASSLLFTTLDSAVPPTTTTEPGDEVSVSQDSEETHSLLIYAGVGCGAALILVLLCYMCYRVCRCGGSQEKEEKYKRKKRFPSSHSGREAKTSEVIAVQSESTIDDGNNQTYGDKGGAFMPTANSESDLEAVKATQGGYDYSQNTSQKVHVNQSSNYYSSQDLDKAASMRTEDMNEYWDRGGSMRSNEHASPRHVE